MSPKNCLKTLFQCFGFDVVRFAPAISHPFDVLSLVVEDILAKGQPFFFVQVGANDGVNDDPLRRLVVAHKLSGLLIEPLPDLFERLRENYRNANLLFENVAVDSKSGSLTIYRVKKNPSVTKQWNWDGIASFNRNHLLREGVPESQIEAVQVRTATISELLAKHSIESFDLLQVDTEGHDYTIVKSVLDGGYRPRIINYEHCHLVPKVRYACQSLLVNQGYRFVEVGKDTLAVRDSQATSGS